MRLPASAVVVETVAAAVVAFAAALLLWPVPLVAMLAVVAVVADVVTELAIVAAVAVVASEKGLRPCPLLQLLTTCEHSLSYDQKSSVNLSSTLFRYGLLLPMSM